MVLTSLATALGVPTRILSTRHSHTPDMRWVATPCGEWRFLSSFICSQHLCERSGRGMTRTSRRGAGWTSFEVLVIVWTRWKSCEASVVRSRQ